MKLPRLAPLLLVAMIAGGVASSLVTPIPIAEASSGRGRIYSASALGGSPASYRLVVDSTTNITVGDHVLAQVSGGGSGVWKVTAKTTTTLDVREDLTEQNGSAFGMPLPGAANSFAFATPTVDGYTLLPDGAQFWGAAYRRNVFLGTAAGFVNTSRSINTTSPLAGGGNLTADRTLSLGTVPANLGGTGLTSYTTGDMLYASGAGALSALAHPGAANRVLSSATGPAAPSWLTVSALLDASLGSTRGAVLRRGAAGWEIVAPGTSGWVLTSAGAGADPAYAALPGTTHALLSASVTDSTPGTVARGDLVTGQGASATWTRLALGGSGRYVRSDGTDASWAQLAMGDATGTLAAANGGTGFGSGGGAYTQGDTLYASGASSLSKLALGTAGQCYMVNAGPTGPQWGTLGAAGGGTSFSTWTRGDLLTASGSTTLVKLARGNAFDVLRMASGGLDPEWGTLSTTLDNVMGSTQGQVLYRSGSAWTVLATGTKNQALVTKGASANPAYLTVVNPQTAGGRLTAQDNTPVPTADQTSSTLYYEAYTGGLVAVYDGSAAWSYLPIGSGLTLAIGGLTTGKNYDIFVFDSAGTATLENSAAWTNDTTRADALVRQDGVWVKSGATTRRYLGTIRTITSGTVKCTDTNAQRYVWNMQNRVKRVSHQLESTASWAISGSVGTWAGFNSGAASGKYELVVGWAEDDHESNWTTFVQAGASTALQAGVKWDWTSGAPTEFTETTANGASQDYATCAEKVPGIGYHWKQAIYTLAGTGNSTTIYGQNRYVFTNVGWY